MEKLPPIPIPLKQHWREFRIGVLPVLVFAAFTFGVATLWRSHVMPPHVIGEVESQWANVASPLTGSLVALTAQRFQTVEAGETIAQILITNPEVISASLDVIRAEVGLVQAQMQQTQNRVALDYERLRLDWMIERVEQAAAKVRLQQAEREFQRMTKMFAERIVPEGGALGYEAALRDRDELVAEIDAREVALAQIEESLARIQTPETVSPIAAALALQEHQLRLAEAELAPLILRAPIDGLVSFVHRRPGETVVAGEPIITLSQMHGDRIVAFIRQPVNVEPRPGMEIVVRSRAASRASAGAEILAVGTQMEMIPPGLLPRSMFAADETGLPILVSLPPGLNLRPGELVDLTFTHRRPFWNRSPP